ncbi:transcriptional regulator, DeoR family [Paenibacillus sp. JCM 10914]|nr:transcriptional regulator, DeoR family [Paenibacillus sp. JCM 10914]
MRADRLLSILLMLQNGGKQTTAIFSRTTGGIGADHHSGYGELKFSRHTYLCRTRLSWRMGARGELPYEFDGHEA